jgi:hypothetical protein
MVAPPVEDPLWREATRSLRSEGGVGTTKTNQAPEGWQPPLSFTPAKGAPMNLVGPVPHPRPVNFTGFQVGLQPARPTSESPCVSTLPSKPALMNLRSNLRPLGFETFIPYFGAILVYPSNPSINHPLG